MSQCVLKHDEVGCLHRVDRLSHHVTPRELRLQSWSGEPGAGGVDPPLHRIHWIEVGGLVIPVLLDPFQGIGARKNST